MIGDANDTDDDAGRDLVEVLTGTEDESRLNDSRVQSLDSNAATGVTRPPSHKLTVYAKPLRIQRREPPYRYVCARVMGSFQHYVRNKNHVRVIVT